MTGWPSHGVYKAGQYTWFVPSKSASDAGAEAYRRVDWHHHPTTGIVYTCTCPAGVIRGQMRSQGEPHERPCRHVLAVAEAERAADAATATPRPQGRVNPATFVD